MYTNRPFGSKFVFEGNGIMAAAQEENPGEGVDVPRHSPPPAFRNPSKQLREAFSSPRVSVVIVNHNGVDLLWSCLFALQTQTLKPFEIILVDNASTDASVSFVKSNYPNIKVLECQENFGFAAAANLGAKFAEGNLIALLDNDAVPTPDWLFRLVVAFRMHLKDVGAVTSEVKPKKEEAKPGPRHDFRSFLGGAVEGFFRTPGEIFSPVRCAMLYSPVFLPEGPFDSDYFIYEEDVYLGWKLRLQGRKIYRSTEAKLFHEGGGTSGRLPKWKTDFYRVRNRWLNLLVFYEEQNLWKVFPCILVEAAARWLWELLTDWRAWWGTTSAIGWFLAHPRAVYQKRQAVQKRRKIPDSEILSCQSGRVFQDGGIFSTFLNLLSLSYCRLAGLRIAESGWPENTAKTFRPLKEDLGKSPVQE